MVKVFIAIDELYPFFILSTQPKSQSLHSHSWRWAQRDVPADKLKWIENVSVQNGLVQEYLEKIYEEKDVKKEE